MKKLKLQVKKLLKFLNFVESEKIKCMENSGRGFN